MESEVDKIEGKVDKIEKSMEDWRIFYSINYGRSSGRVRVQGDCDEKLCVKTYKKSGYSL